MNLFSSEIRTIMLHAYKHFNPTSQSQTLWTLFNNCLKCLICETYFFENVKILKHTILTVLYCVETEKTKMTEKNIM